MPLLSIFGLVSKISNFFLSVTVRIKCGNTVSQPGTQHVFNKWKNPWQFEKTSPVLLWLQIWIPSRGFCHPCHFLHFFPNKWVLPLNYSKNSLPGLLTGIPEELSSKASCSLTLQWWVGTQSYLVGSSTWPWALGPWPSRSQVLEDKQAPKRKQSGHREHDASEVSERQAQHREYQERMASPN